MQPWDTGLGRSVGDMPDGKHHQYVVFGRRADLRRSV